MRLTILAVLMLLPASALAQEDVIRVLTPEQAEKILKARKLAFKKPDAEKGDVIYDFKKSGVPMAFYLLGGGKDVMIDAVLPALPFEAINQWNAAAKFSRAFLRREGPQLVSILETNLDLQGGVTLEAVNRLFDTFDAEVKGFLDHVSKSFKDEPLFDVVSGEKLDKLLDRMGVKFAKKEGKEAATYDFELKGQKVKLTSVGGKELFFDAAFPEIPLEKTNRYNLSKKFIRAVNLKAEGEPFTSLQAALDVSGGVTESIVMHFLASFEVEIGDFRDFTRKLKKE